MALEFDTTLVRAREAPTMIGSFGEPTAAAAGIPIATRRTRTPYRAGTSRWPTRIDRLMTTYYILAVSFGGLSALLSAYAIWGRKDRTGFPGALYLPIMLAGVVFAVATLTFVVIGGNEESKEKHDAASETAALNLR